jgi:cell division protein FtsQ
MDPRIGRRRAAVTRAQGRRRLHVVVVGVVVVALAVAALIVLHTSLFSARHVRVVGAQHTGRSRVLRVAGLVGGPPLIDVSSGADVARLEALPWVAHASVARHWPDSVVVRVVERVPVAAVAAGDRTGETVLVDATGRVLARVTAAPAGLPVLSSPARPGRPGTTLGPAARPGLLVADDARRILPGRVRGVAVDAGGAVVLDLGSGVRATLGPASAAGSKLAALASVLAGAPPTGPELIDVSVPGEPTVAPGASAPA